MVQVDVHTKETYPVRFRLFALATLRVAKMD